MRFYKAFPWSWTSPLDQLPNFIDETPNEATCERLFHTKSTENTECRVECYGLTQMAQTFAETCGAKFCVFLCFLCATTFNRRTKGHNAPRSLRLCVKIKIWSYGLLYNKLINSWNTDVWKNVIFTLILGTPIQYFCLKNCKQNSVCFCAVCKYFSRKGAKSAWSAWGYFTRNPQKTQNIAPQVADFFQLIIQFFSCRENKFSCRENKFSCRENKFSCREKKIPCLGNKISMPWKKNYQGWK